MMIVMTSIVIGNFDGVHRGHQALIKKALGQSANPLSALTFAPHPRRYFQPDIPPFALCDDDSKGRLLREMGVDDVITLPFDAAMAGLSANAFIEKVLVKQLGVTQIFVGQDFHFGKGRDGSVVGLIADGRFDVQPIDLAREHAEIISSSRIRELIRLGQMNAANDLLGWQWFINGVVQTGDQRGRLLGYPTANVTMGDYVVPSYGIYASKIEVDGRIYGGVSNIGIRPMFEAPAPLLEAHIFDFDQDIYGHKIKVFPIQKIRDEANFEDLDALKRQMDDDSAKARLALASGIE